MSAAAVTVFCPIYNDVEYIDDFVTSVLGQTWEDFDLFILENGSTERTRSKLMEYKDPRIRIVTSHINFRSETGASVVRQVSSKYLAVIFSDDTYSPEKLEVSIQALERTGADVCFSNSLFMRNDKSPMDTKEVPPSQYPGDLTLMSVCEHLWHMVKRGNTLHPVSMVIRTDTYHELGGFRGDLHQIGDMEFFSRLLLLKKVEFIKQPLQTIRLRHGARVTNESTITDASRRRVRSERLNFISNFRCPEALALVDQIFLPKARGIIVPDYMRLWYLGQQFVHEFEPDYRIFGMTCLYDALKMHGPELEPVLTASIGITPGAYLDSLSNRIFNGFDADESSVNRIAMLQAEIQALRREIGNVHRSETTRSGTASAELLTQEIDLRALEFFKEECRVPKRRVMRWQKGERPIIHSLPGFDAAYYLQSNPDVVESGVAPVRHYLRFGWKEGRNPSAAFNTNAYLAANMDVRNAGLNPLLHFLEHGRKEGRRGWEVFGH